MRLCVRLLVKKTFKLSDFNNSLLATSTKLQLKKEKKRLCVRLLVKKTFKLSDFNNSLLATSTKQQLKKEKSVGTFLFFKFVCGKNAAYSKDL